ncbi:FAD-binding oxidoreductase [Bradyrhizobium sp. CCGB12]|uniref:NAD(P)/FAD-dependent oxidoreductase n=1 Tax=Bradyrhizobium sp. CCGB12 TaxID=2949632 RepID=UPI0020B2B43D|nr:FAD-binding oxidoreductase [Bradyrhizobium sp. CCGB12]MCP3392247.1 FAD-binding oxidoreductase [Bradyrhizobium sp. CCGB12]
MKSRSTPHYSVACGWNALLPARAVRVEAPSKRKYDAIVVGAGFTGLAIARRFAELQPTKEILVLDAAEIGEGLSGRNSGILAPTVIQPRANAFGSAEEDAARKSRIVLAGLDWLRDVVKNNDIRCDWIEDAPRIVAAATKQGVDKVRTSLASLTKRALRYRERDREDLLVLIGTRYYEYGCEGFTHALIQPAALIRGLADTLPANVTLLERTAAEAIEGSGLFQVVTKRGNFVGEKVFVANNAHARSLDIALYRMVVVHTYGALTPELDDTELDLLGRLPEWAILPPTAMGTTMRKWKRRILIRSGHSYERETSIDKVRSLLSSLYRNRYPTMPSYEFEHVWGGGVGITSNRENYFGELRRGLFVSAGCQGAGVLRGSIHGKLLAELACESQSSLLADRMKLSGPKWIPPEPLRGMGAVAQMAWQHWQAGREF